MEKTLEIPLDCEEIKPVNPKGNQPEYSLERLLLKLKVRLEEPALWKRPWSWERLKAKRRRGRKRMRWLDSITDSSGHGFEQTIGDSEGQRGLECCSSWSRKESDTTYRLNNNKLSRKVPCLFWDRTRRLWPSAHARSLPLLSLLACSFRSAVSRWGDSGASGVWTRPLSRTSRWSPAESRQETGGQVKEETALSSDSVWLTASEDQTSQRLLPGEACFFSFPRCGVVWDLGRPRRNRLRAPSRCALFFSAEKLFFFPLRASLRASPGCPCPQ